MNIKYKINSEEVDNWTYEKEVDAMLLEELVNTLIANDEYPEDMSEEEAREMYYDDIENSGGTDYILDGLKEDYYFDSIAGLKKDGFYEQEINGKIFREEIINTEEV